MAIETVATILSRAIGFDVESVGEPAFMRAVRSRLDALSLHSIDTYCQYVEATPAEIQELTEAVVVSETWFFRDQEAFITTVKHCRERLETRPGTRLRLLSVPCSTGEEPYSIAMALLDAGVSDDQFRIDAFDISGHAIARAKEGVYGKNSFRGEKLAFATRHFTATPRGAAISDRVRSKVHFARANILDRDFVVGEALYDIIFCRNMLIYFDDPARTAAVSVLARLLQDHGMLFVGPSEAGLMLESGLASIKVPLAFAFQKASAARPAPLAVAASGTRAPETPRPRVHVRHQSENPTPAEPIGSGAGVGDVSRLGDIARLADQGQLAAAERACALYLRESEPTAEALLLLGLIHDAAGKGPEAAGDYRKALYLDPFNPQVLMHLALLLQKQGDAAGAKVISDRLRRRRA